MSVRDFFSSHMKVVNKLPKNNVESEEQNRYLIFATYLNKTKSDGCV